MPILQSKRILGESSEWEKWDQDAELKDEKEQKEYAIGPTAEEMIGTNFCKHGSLHHIRNLPINFVSNTN